MRIPVPAYELSRNTSVLRVPDELPYLVDSVEERWDDVLGFLVRVEFSSGDVDVYYSTETVTTVVTTD